MIFRDLLAQFTVRNVIDIVLVAVFFYQIIAMMRGTRAAQVVVGLLVIFIAYAFSSLMELETLYWIISKFYASFIVVVIVLFQDDIRRILTRFGRGPFVAGLEEGSGFGVIEEVMSSARHLSHERLGAILVFERGIGLDRLYDHAIRLDALVSEQLLISIFQSFSPLHDGAVIIQKNRILCASAHLPLSKTPGTGKKTGTRHSAATGISEQTDAVVLVVSEETGAISIAVNGELFRQQSPESAKRVLTQLLIPQKRVSRVAEFFQGGLFADINVMWLKMRARFGGKPYVGAERRSRSSERRYGSSASWIPSAEALQAVERENRLAANEVRLNLRFPGGAPQRKSMQTSGGTLIFSKQNLAGSQVASAPPRTSEALSSSSARMDLGEIQNADGGQSAPLESDSVMVQNEAAAAISHLSEEDRLVPPEPPASPPCDVSIGGVSIMPPLEATSEVAHDDVSHKKPQSRKNEGGDQ
jgi:diadenylate cyclase